MSASSNPTSSSVWAWEWCCVLRGVLLSVMTVFGMVATNGFEYIGGIGLLLITAALALLNACFGLFEAVVALLQIRWRRIAGVERNPLQCCLGAAIRIASPLLPVLAWCIAQEMIVPPFNALHRQAAAAVVVGFVNDHEAQLVHAVETGSEPEGTEWIVKVHGRRTAIRVGMEGIIQGWWVVYDDGPGDGDERIRRIKSDLGWDVSGIRHIRGPWFSSAPDP